MPALNSCPMKSTVQDAREDKTILDLRCSHLNWRNGAYSLNMFNHSVEMSWVTMQSVANLTDNGESSLVYQ